MLADTQTRLSSRTRQSILEPLVFIVGSPWSGTTLLYHMLLSSGDFAVYLMESNVFDLAFPQFGDFRARRNRLGDQTEYFFRERSECRRLRSSRSVEKYIPAGRTRGAGGIDRTESSKTRLIRNRFQPFEGPSFALERNADIFPHLLECEAMTQDENLRGRFVVKPGSLDL
jgi:hypothetical protein